MKVSKASSTENGIDIIHDVQYHWCSIILIVNKYKQHLCLNVYKRCVRKRTVETLKNLDDF